MGHRAPGDTELPVLAGAGAVAHEEAVAWAHEQYDAFAERRRLEAETAADAHYFDDLRTSAKMMETERKNLPAPKSGKARKAGERRRDVNP